MFRSQNAGILNPTSRVSNYGNSDIYLALPYYLWNLGNTNNNQDIIPITKTLYDPSPRGFCVPPLSAFERLVDYWTGFLGDEKKTEREEYINNYVSEKGDWNFPLSEEEDNVLYFPYVDYSFLPSGGDSKRPYNTPYWSSAWTRGLEGCVFKIYRASPSGDPKVEIGTFHIDGNPEYNLFTTDGYAAGDALPVRPIKMNWIY